MKWILLILLLPMVVQADISDITVEITDIKIHKEEIVDQDGQITTNFKFQNELTIYNPTEEKITIKFPNHYPFAVNITTDVEGVVGYPVNVGLEQYHLVIVPGETLWFTNSTFSISDDVSKLPDGEYMLEILGPPDSGSYQGGEITYLNAYIYVSNGNAYIQLQNRTFTQKTPMFFYFSVLIIIVILKNFSLRKNKSLFK